MAYTAIDDPTKYFQTKKYTGNGTAIGSGGLSVTFDDTAFQPDLVWSKNKDDGTGLIEANKYFIERKITFTQVHDCLVVGKQFNFLVAKLSKLLIQLI